MSGGKLRGRLKSSLGCNVQEENVSIFSFIIIPDIILALTGIILFYTSINNLADATFDHVYFAKYKYISNSDMLRFPCGVFRSRPTLIVFILLIKK